MVIVPPLQVVMRVEGGNACKALHSPRSAAGAQQMLAIGVVIVLIIIIAIWGNVFGEPRF